MEKYMSVTLVRWERRLREEHPELDETLGRVADQATRIAGLMAVVDASAMSVDLDCPIPTPAITEEHLDYAMKLVEALMMNFSEANEKHGAETATERDYKRTLEVIKMCMTNPEGCQPAYRKWLKAGVLPESLLTNRLFKKFDFGRRRDVTRHADCGGGSEASGTVIRSERKRDHYPGFVG